MNPASPWGPPTLTDEQRELARKLRAALATASDEQLDLLLGYSLGYVAALIVGYMTPEQRMGFVAHLRAKYPEAFAAGAA